MDWARENVDFFFLRGVMAAHMCLDREGVGLAGCSVLERGSRKGLCVLPEFQNQTGHDWEW